MPREIPIHLYRRIGGAAGAPGALLEGEPGYNNTGANGNANGDLFIGDGTAVRTLVSANRQVELTGAQAITAAGAVKTFSIVNLRITGGTDGQVVSLVDNTTGELGFITPTAPGITVNTPPFTGNGTSGSALGLSVAATTDIDAGTNNVLPVTSAGVRHLTGDLATLDAGFTATSLVSALNEVYGHIATLQAGVTPVGTFNATTNTVTPFSGSPAVAGALPAPAAANKGWLLYVTTAGTGGPSPPAPGTALAVGDQLLSPGDTGTIWDHIALGAATVVASGVTITAITGPPALTGTNVQTALESLNTRSGTALTYIDGTSITGLTATLGAGLTAANALKVGTIDGGTF